jgi:hypothetical protein
VAVLLVVVLVTSWAAGNQLSPPSPDGGSTDAVRLGPAAGQDVAAYLAGTLAVPAPSDPAPRLALVQFDAALTPDAAAVALTGTAPVQAVVRVPLPRVQTALHRVDLPPAPPAAALRAALTTAGGEAGAAAGTAGAPSSPADARRVAVARAEAAALGRSDCPCLIGAVVQVVPAALPAVRGASRVRAVQVTPPGTGRSRLAVSPLLPEQGAGRPDGPTVGPVPDDGPVPP